MAGIDFSIQNIFSFIGYISPFIVTFLMVMISLMNQNIKGIIYLAGVLMVSVVTTLLINLAGSAGYVTKTNSPLCGIFNIPFLGSGGAGSIPPFNSVLIMFTFAYTYLPMLYNNQMNYPFFAFLLSLFLIDGISKVNEGCTRYMGVFIGGVIGYLLGSLFYMIIDISGHKDLLFFNEIASDKAICEKPTRKTFKCQVYKNGQLIKTM